MRFSDIGQQLRAYRLESGLRAEDIAGRLGVSRAALYRYEKGEVIKLDTVQRLAELLQISPLSLLGIGVEYYSRPVGFFERLRQLEETAEQILQVDGAVSYLITGTAYDAAFAAALDDAADAAGEAASGVRAAAEQLLGVLAARKRMQAQRRPGIICILSTARLAAFLRHGVGADLAASPAVRAECRRAAAQEVARIAEHMASEPMGLQFGLLETTEPSAAFTILRARDRASLAVNPFRPDSPPLAAAGVAMITVAEEALAAHQRVAETLWREASKGAPAAARLRALLAEFAAA